MVILSTCRGALRGKTITKANRTVKIRTVHLISGSRHRKTKTLPRLIKAFSKKILPLAPKNNKICYIWQLKILMTQSAQFGKYKTPQWHQHGSNTSSRRLRSVESLNQRPDPPYPTRGAQKTSQPARWLTSKWSILPRPLLGTSLWKKL